MKKFSILAFVIVAALAFVACANDNNASQEATTVAAATEAEAEATTQEEVTEAVTGAQEEAAQETTAETADEAVEALTEIEATTVAEATATTAPEVATTVAQAATTPAPTTAAEITTTAAPAAGLVGNWDWMGMPYYTFNADGTGQMSGMPIRWTSARGVLSICNTPAICGSTCIAPAEWNYTITGNTLRLVSTLLPDLAFDYTRR